MPEEPREHDTGDMAMLSLKRVGRVGIGELHGEPMARER
jgi:hypothetical protein